jgi:hypothetical protein
MKTSNKLNDKKLKLIESDESDKEDLKELTINKNYADRYNNWREKEELQKCILILFYFDFKSIFSKNIIYLVKDKYGDVDNLNSSEESTDESEDEDAIVIFGKKI